MLNAPAQIFAAFLAVPLRPTTWKAHTLAPYMLYCRASSLDHAVEAGALPNGPAWLGAESHALLSAVSNY